MAESLLTKLGFQRRLPKQEVTGRSEAGSRWACCSQFNQTNLLDSLISYQPVRTLRSSSSNLLVVPNCVKTVTASHTFRVAAPTIWNNLPDSVKVADSFNVFKRRLKSRLFNEANRIFKQPPISNRHLCLAVSQAANYGALNQQNCIVL